MVDNKRRRLIKNSAIVGTVIGSAGSKTGFPGIVDSASAKSTHSEIDYEWKLGDSENAQVQKEYYSGGGYYYDIRNEISKSFHLVQTVDDGTGQKLHTILASARLGSQWAKRDCYYCDRGGWQDNSIQDHKVRIEIEDSSSTLYPPDGSGGLGCDPAPPATNPDDMADNFEDAAFTAFLVAASFSSPWVAAGIGASQVAAALLESNDPEEDPNTQTYEWGDYYHPDTIYEGTEYAHHYTKFYVVQDKNQSSEVRVKHSGTAHSPYNTGSSDPTYPVSIDYTYYIDNEPDSFSTSDTGVENNSTTEDSRIENYYTDEHMIEPKEIPEGTGLARFADGDPVYKVPSSLISVRAERND